MSLRLAHVTLVVHDYDEAIEYFVGSLGFELRCDEALSPTKRWVVVEPSGGGTSLLLARAQSEEQTQVVGRQAGGRVAFFLHTDRFEEHYRRFSSAGVRFVEEPRDEPYGRVVVFEDLYGNRWDLVQPATAS